ncbi:hypothetical protein [uncultured Paracoccus sp.]|uniref:hypothetical protein n=1 Tax=uncultured Paracoccus sp. TaxID=189685 RepID=UPI00260E723B|nr:hypothetical protein [uncultured Paracoccus sp.]
MAPPVPKPVQGRKGDRTGSAPLSLTRCSGPRRHLADDPWSANGVAAAGVTINDGLLQEAQPALPCGGTRDSGMGSSRDAARFDRTAHLLPVLVLARWNGVARLRPSTARFRLVINPLPRRSGRQTVGELQPRQSRV